MTTLRISPSLTLPIDALVKRHFIVGQSGSGKTNAAVVLFEEFANAGQQVVAIDSTGVWWGLRSSHGGKADGLDVFILGGEHGDMALEPSAGGVIADFVVQSARSFVLDLSLMKKVQATMFMHAFCERLYESKATNKAPLHLIVDEADLYAPETPSEKGGKLLLEAMDNLARRGRARGIGMTLITQRPQVINKSIIAQADILYVFRLSHPLDRGALSGWVRGNASPEQLDAFNEGLAKLPRGDCFAWSPEWLKLFRHVHVRQRETFDSSSTPEVGVAVARPKVMTKIDIAGLRAAITKTIEIEKAESPMFLRARIVELEGQLKRTPREVEIQRVVPKDVERAVTEIGRLVAIALGAIAKTVETSKVLVATSPPISDEPHPLNGPHGVVLHVPTNGKRVKFAGLDSGLTQTLKRMPAGDSKLGKCERAILTVLAQHGPRTKSQIGILATYSSKSGGFRNSLSVLRTAKFIYDQDARIAITKAGHDALGTVEKLPRGRELLEYWKRTAGGLCERTILDVLAEAYPQRLAKDRIVKETARFKDDGAPYSVSSGGFRNALSRLRTLELVNGKSELALASTLAEAS